MLTSVQYGRWRCDSPVGLVAGANCHALMRRSVMCHLAVMMRPFLVAAWGASPGALRAHLSASQMRWRWQGAPHNASLHAWMEDRDLGPTSASTLSPFRLEELRQRVVAARTRAPPGVERGRTQRFHQLVNFLQQERTEGTLEARAAVIGYGGIDASLGLDTAPLLSIHGSWGTGLLPVKLCSMASCFDPCRRACEARPLPVYWYFRNGSRDPRAICERQQCSWLFERLADGGDQTVRFVDSADDACVFVYTYDSHRRKRFQFQDLAHWRAADGVAGRNHILIWPSRLDEWGDLVAPKRRRGSLGEAIVASPNVLRGIFRPGFDFHLFLDWTRPMTEMVERRAQLPSRRRFLYTFKGSVMTSGTPGLTGRRSSTKWNDDRAILGATVPSGTDDALVVVYKWAFGCARACAAQVDGRPCRKCSIGPAHALRNWSYAALLAASYYSVCPGGVGPFSFRLLEALASGSVPVITSDMLVPMERSSGPSGGPMFEGDWSACVVRVSRSELYALRDTLLAVGAPGSPAYGRRKAACQRLWESISGAGDLRLSPAQVERTFRRRVGGAFWDQLGARITQTRTKCGGAERVPAQGHPGTLGVR